VDHVRSRVCAVGVAFGGSVVMALVAALVVAYILVGCLRAYGRGSAGFVAIVGASFANASC
jgi:hypothetical protein